MALKDNWEDLEDKVQGDPDSGSEISVKPINAIAHAVIELENQDPIQSNVQADWNEENPGNPAYINNKPTIPSVEGLASVEYVDDAISSAMGDVETALDEIISIQNAILGVSE